MSLPITSSLKEMLSHRLVRNWAPGAIKNHSSRCLATFCFDDFPSSAGRAGTAILEKVGAKATFFVAGHLAGKTIDGIEYFTSDLLVEISKSGHEIGCHTFSHLVAPLATREKLQGDIIENHRFVREHLGNYDLVSFAYPFGAVTVTSKKWLGKQFLSCRGIWGEVNGDWIDITLLKAIELNQPFRIDRIRKLLDRAVATKGWIIFFTHDVSDNPSRFGCKPSELERVVSEVVAREIPILPMKEAALEVQGLAAGSLAPGSISPSYTSKVDAQSAFRQRTAALHPALTRDGWAKRWRSDR